MGKGDKKTKRGKIFAGSFGKHRPRKDRNVASANMAQPSTPKAAAQEEE